ncbi:MAG: 4-alpha-glucanotransferase, partial [Candidatus Eisenbacteria bacterium]|nr:4-alpha-glucanotransferase [Candidatus Eisenbacteria bacterium]
LYLDLEAACDLAGRPEVAVQRLSSEQRRAESAALRREDLVDYRRAMAHKRPILEELAQSFFDEGRDRSDPDYRSYLERAPRAEDYARFRATVERHHATWQAWPERQRDGTLQDGDFDLAAMRAHLFAQYALDRQFLDLAETTRRSGPGLYLDFPLGVNGGGYDVWRERDSFAIGASGGAPPDLFFRKGQDWGFPPPHPERIRETGYRYQIDSLRRHLRYAGVLRIDHVMGLHRLYWVPWGMEATRGAYVRYHADELFAILALESRRAGSMVVGENLGTVPKEVNEAMERHGIRKMFVLQYEIVESAQELPAVVPPDSVASVNTHDMATFRSFLEGLDIARRVELGFLSEEAAEEERAGRRRVRSKLVESLSQAGWIEGLAGDDPGTRTILEASLSYLAASESEVVVASLEDLWLEAQGQNVPGTTQEHPNWRRKARYDLEGLDQLPAVTQLLARIDRLRGERDGEAGRSGERDREEGRREGESGA